MPRNPLWFDPISTKYIIVFSPEDETLIRNNSSNNLYAKLLKLEGIEDVQYTPLPRNPWPLALTVDITHKNDQLTKREVLRVIEEHLRQCAETT